MLIRHHLARFVAAAMSAFPMARPVLRAVFAPLRTISALPVRLAKPIIAVKKFLPMNANAVAAKLMPTKIVARL